MLAATKHMFKASKFDSISKAKALRSPYKMRIRLFAAVETGVWEVEDDTIESSEMKMRMESEFGCIDSM